ncbi:hypothetical protein [Nocardia transvalensis]|uniref:hypothetical protein n=1 Tax=Nocardia transvalensis TaxID=37333 RepID=UPI001894148D|nr:hypothetical protein [Nocardia transvalensis]MBF6333668.1 hypothetical protein [Nocardia transvalensis]
MTLRDAIQFSLVFVGMVYLGVAVVIAIWAWRRTEERTCAKCGRRHRGQRIQGAVLLGLTWGGVLCIAYLYRFPRVRNYVDALLPPTATREPDDGNEGCALS